MEKISKFGSEIQLLSINFLNRFLDFSIKEYNYNSVNGSYIDYFSQGAALLVIIAFHQITFQAVTNLVAK